MCWSEGGIAGRGVRGDRPTDVTAPTTRGLRAEAIEEANATREAIFEISALFWWSGGGFCWRNSFVVYSRMCFL